MEGKISEGKKGGGQFIANHLYKKIAFMGEKSVEIIFLTSSFCFPS